MHIYPTETETLVNMHPKNDNNDNNSTAVFAAEPWQYSIGVTFHKHRVY